MSTTSPDPLSTVALLAESAWLKRLALRLVSEGRGAEDATQEALLKALAHPPPRAVPLRRWLAAVLRNVVRHERRAHARRELRERARQPVQHAEPADAFAERLELHEQLAAAVRALEEPYRTTVALRFLEELTPPSIAARTGVPLKTVHSRLERALVLLRERLDRTHGGRETWMRALLLFPRAPLDLAGPATGLPSLASILALSTLWKWTGACASVAFLGCLAMRAREQEAPLVPARPAAARALDAELVLATTPLLASVPPGTRDPLEPQVSDSASAPSGAAPAARADLLGFVLDLERRPMAGLTVTYAAVGPAPLFSGSPTVGEAQDESGADGRFVLPWMEGPLRIVARGRGFATVIAPIRDGRASLEEPIVFVAPAGRYSGAVLDEDGMPIANARLALELEHELARALTPGTFTSATAIARGTSGDDGRFEFPEVGLVSPSFLVVSADGFLAAELELPAGSTDTLVVRLLRGGERGLRGRVLTAEGEPAQGAYVSLGSVATRTDVQGAFVFEREPGVVVERVRAVLPGRLPAERRLSELEPGEELVLTLGGEALALAGRVLDAAGQPVADARVWTTDGERFGDVPTLVGSIALNLSFDIEGVIGGADPQRHQGGRRTRTAQDGSFELTGLLERRYALFALEPRSRALVGPLEFDAGSRGVVLSLPDEPRQRVAGRVTTPAGVPVPGASVRVRRMGRDRDGSRRILAEDELMEVLTDAEGSFVFPALCTERSELAVSLDHSQVEVRELALETDLEDVRVLLHAPCHLRVSLTEPEMADALDVLDEHEHPLLLAFQLGGIHCSAVGAEIRAGVSDLLVTDERARTLVLRKGADEVLRLPLQLVPGRVNEVRP